MPLSNEANFGVRPLTDAINNLPVTPTTIRESGLFINPTTINQPYTLQ